MTNKLISFKNSYRPFLQMVILKGINKLEIELENVKNKNLD